jgi:rSAM/selenodomain-associated transferase 1
MGQGLPSLLLFARTPVRGRVKTRLVPPLSEAEALRLYLAFLEDAARTYSSPPRWHAVLDADPDPDDPALRTLFPLPWRRHRQTAGDLGERLAGSFEREFSQGVPAAIAVGSDHPALELRLLEEAFGLLAGGDDAVVIPAEDGGYCAIGLVAGAPVRELFSGIAWSSPSVLATTRSRLDSLTLRAAILEPGYDVDRPEDLERLRADLARRDPTRPDYPRATARVLGVFSETS